MASVKNDSLCFYFANIVIDIPVV